MNPLAEHLARYTPDDWRQAVLTLEASAHEIDRDATRIWFAFFPLELHLAFEEARRADDPADAQAALVRRYELMGNWRLSEQVDSSHRFLFAHRFWPQVKSAIQAWSDPPPAALPALVTAVAEAAARTARVDREMLLGMTAVGLMTLRQAGMEAFQAAPGQMHLTPPARAISAHQLLRRRSHDDWQGPLGFLRGTNRRYSVTFDEGDPAATFPVFEAQELASGAQSDKRDYRSRDRRCTPNEGPIPVQCRSASCGTCWVGVLSGADKLSPVHERDEGRRMKVFGYIDTDDPKPIVRLACQARASGNVSIVIPPWNGVIGRLMRR